MRILIRIIKNGAGDNQFGAKLDDLRKVANKVMTNHELAKQLWEKQKPRHTGTGNLIDEV